MTASKRTEFKVTNQPGGLAARKKTEFKGSAAEGSKLTAKGKPAAKPVCISALGYYKRSYLKDVLKTKPLGYVPTSYYFQQAAERWESMSDSDKAPFEAMAEALKNRKVVKMKFPGDAIAEHEKAMDSVRTVSLMAKFVGLNM